MSGSELGAIFRLEFYKKQYKWSSQPSHRLLQRDGSEADASATATSTSLRLRRSRTSSAQSHSRCPRRLSLLYLSFIRLAYFEDDAIPPYYCIMYPYIPSRSHEDDAIL
ncbi:hypothetical protein EVAR_58213_1 [Eumeta japonica]|uniref:Uncharacterized protein n=1 Tax=Eumeta variegata TaxID=151549 RepID=A0A4C1YTY2_EUMVA|nr:hypothetical protein EVAR_58213_1 [Eumeta japonica]